MSLLKRLIPFLLLDEDRLVKTVGFSSPKYIGDPINAIKLFNDLGADEIVVLNINRNRSQNPLPYEMIHEICSEAFMPIAYGGGISSVDQMKELFRTGIEKVVVNSSFYSNPSLIPEAVKIFGSQSIVGSIDVKKTLFGGYNVMSQSGQKKVDLSLLEVITRFQESGVGEIIIQDIGKEGSLSGMNLELLKTVAPVCKVPLVFSSGLSSFEEAKAILRIFDVNALAAGSLFVYYGPKKAVLINYPNETEMRQIQGLND